MTNVTRANRTIEDRARLGLGYDTQDDDTDPATDEIQHTFEGVAGAGASGLATQTELDTHATAAPAAAVHGLPKVTLAAGTASGADVTVTGMVVGDVLVSVLAYATAASIATVADRTSEYAVQAGGLDKAAGTNETNNQLVIYWIDAT